MKIRVGHCAGCGGFPEGAVTTSNRWKIQSPRERSAPPSPAQDDVPIEVVDFITDADVADEPAPAPRRRSSSRWLPIIAVLAALAVAMAILRP